MAVVALCSTAQLAWAEDSIFLDHDLNGDGFISPSEYDLFRQYLLLSLDFDSDGRISTDEWNSWDPRDAGIPIADKQIGLAYSAMANVFITADTNVDGYLSEQELSAALLRDFSKVDEDQNGFLNPSEFEKAFLLPHEIEVRIAELAKPPA
jgi:EF hand